MHVQMCFMALHMYSRRKLQDSSALTPFMKSPIQLRLPSPSIPSIVSDHVKSLWRGKTLAFVETKNKKKSCKVPATTGCLKKRLTSGDLKTLPRLHMRAPYTRISCCMSTWSALFSTTLTLSSCPFSVPITYTEQMFQ